MPKRTALRTPSCPVDRFQRIISGKYKLRILWDLRKGALRYSEIKRGLLQGRLGTGEIAPRVLSRELKALAETGLIHRHDYGMVPPKVAYNLTDAGERLIPIISSMHTWGVRNLASGV